MEEFRSSTFSHHAVPTLVFTNLRSFHSNHVWPVWCQIHQTNVNLKKRFCHHCSGSSIVHTKMCSSPHTKLTYLINLKKLQADNPGCNRLTHWCQLCLGRGSCKSSVTNGSQVKDSFRDPLAREYPQIHTQLLLLSEKCLVLHASIWPCQMQQDTHIMQSESSSSLEALEHLSRQTRCLQYILLFFAESIPSSWPR